MRRKEQAVPKSKVWGRASQQEEGVKACGRNSWRLKEQWGRRLEQGVSPGYLDQLAEPYWSWEGVWILFYP